VPALAHVHTAPEVKQAASRLADRVDPAQMPVCC